MMRVFAMAVGVSVFAMACGHSETHQALLRAPGPPTTHVELYLADQPPPARPFYEVALVQAIGFGSEAHIENLMRALTEKAKRLGCDAVVRTFIDQGYSRSHASGVCVRWSGPGPSAPPALLPRDHGPHPLPPSLPPFPAPRIEPLPSAGPGAGGGP
jgi:hypothetical protein